MDSIVIQIENFERFNPRQDVKKPGWFRLDHSMIDSPEFFSFTDAEFKAWIYILSHASRRNEKGKVELFFDHAYYACRITTDALESTIQKLVSLKIVTVLVTRTSRVRYEDGTHTDATDGRTDERDVTLRDGEARTCANVNVTSQLPLVSVSDGKDADAPSPVKEFIARYCEAFKRRYDSNPVIDGKAAGQARSLVKSLGAKQAIALVETYLGMNDSFYLTKRHDLVTFSMNLNAVQVAMKTGKVITRTEAVQADKKQAIANTWGPLIAEAERAHGEPDGPEGLL